MGGPDGDPVIPVGPADIVADIDALMTAANPDARRAATKVILEKAGVVISDAPGAASDSVAGMTIASEELAAIADETASRGDYSRATFAEFARTLGGVGLLPPNDVHAADLPADWPNGESPATDTQASLDLAGQPARLVTVLNGWVNGALAAHGADDPDLVRLTNAPLYLAELARREPQPVDLRASFLAEDLGLNWLDITLLTAGFRSMLLGVEAAGLGPGVGARPAERPVAMARGWPLAAPVAQALGTPCDNLQAWLDARTPTIASIGRSYIGAQIKEFIQSFMFSLAGEAASEVVSHAFKALSILYKVQALMLLYEQAEVKVEMEPQQLHKPVDQPEPATATVTAGIPDDKWEAAKRDRQQTPFSTAVRECARFLNLPVFSDSVTLGDAVKGWQVRWSLQSGGEHVQIPTGEDFWVDGAVPGRLQRPLSQLNDHMGNDILAYQVRPERREDHPGVEHRAPVLLCAHIVPGEPPDGFGTILKAGFAGASLAGGSIVSLLTVIAKLLISWVATVNTIDACGAANVSFHVPKPGKWRGRIVVSSSVNQEVVEHGTTPDRTHDATTTVRETLTDSFYVGGEDPLFANDLGGLSIDLDARQFTQGVGYEQQRAIDVNALQTDCPKTTTRTGDWGGGWWFDADVRLGLEIDSDGTYRINLFAAQPSEDVEWPGALEEDVIDCQGHNTFTTEGPSFPPYLVATPPESLTIQNQFDPTQPTDRLAGSMRWVNQDGSFTSQITWTLVHDGPIRFMSP